jgi:hypothetical protein
MDDTTKGFFRAYFCQGFSTAQQPRPLVYTQVSHSNEVQQAKQYIQDLSQALPGLKFVAGIEPVDDTHHDKSRSPDKTQVRCFTKDQCATGRTLADQLSERTGKPVLVVPVQPSPKAAVNENPVLELWFGKEETGGWSRQ